jgi:hypothetical protein
LWRLTAHCWSGGGNSQERCQRAFRRPASVHRARTDADLVRFEKTHEVVARERLIYALALQAGQRRGDKRARRWPDITEDGWIAVEAREKTGPR